MNWLHLFTDSIDLMSEQVNFHCSWYLISKNFNFQSLAKVNLQNTFRIISYNHDLNGIKFISALEHVGMPFYAVQFHPEKNNFEWIKKENTPHSSNAIRISQYFANFFVDEGKQLLY